MKFSSILLLFLAMAMLPISCSDDEAAPNALTVFSITMNGANLVDGVDDLPINSALTIVFSAALNTADFEQEFSILPSPSSMQFSYANQSSKVTVDLVLDFMTTYQMTIKEGDLGENGGRLESPVSRSFTTMADGIIYSLPACTSASINCLQTVTLTGNGIGGGTGNFNFYSSFPIYEELAEWEDLEAAIIVVHGANRDADNYFNFMMSTLQANNLQGKVVLISPFFKQNQEATGNDYYWGGTGWRDGNISLGPAAISGYEILDKLIGQLRDESHFPVLKKIIIMGHSSGGLFTHLYAASNKAEIANPDLVFEYVVANSQYFYYPDGQRIDENTNQLYTPTDCTGYDIWPYGLSIVPPYLSATNATDYNAQFVGRSITYLLGNGNGADPTLSTSVCSATLLGSTQYNRGENMFRYMELEFPGSHNHKRTLVNGIGHYGSGIYQSPEFRTLLGQLLN